MNTNTKIFVAVLACVAGLAVLLGVARFEPSTPKLLALFLGLALFSSACKVRMPGIEGTYSLSFLVLVPAASRFSLTELHLAAIASALVQSYWKAARRPLAVQVIFNAANAVVSLTAAAALFAATRGVAPAGWDFVTAGVAAGVYYVLNTGMTSWVIALAQQQPARSVWDTWSLYALPYYVAGALLVSSWLPLRDGLALPMFVLQMISVLTIYIQMRDAASRPPMS